MFQDKRLAHCYTINVWHTVIVKRFGTLTQHKIWHILQYNIFSHCYDINVCHSHTIGFWKNDTL